MKTYNHTNFFKHTYCEFQEINDFSFPIDQVFKSASNSLYHYTKKGVYRKSNHWGRVANCRWRLLSKSKYKNQQTVIGFAKWSDFYPINSNARRFYISFDFVNNKADLKIADSNATHFLFSYQEALSRIKEIKKLLTQNSWINYIDGDKKTVQKEIIEQFINTTKSAEDIKRKNL